MSNDPFYTSKPWFKVKAKLKAQWRMDNRPCAFCNKPIDWINGTPIADHILNRIKYPHLALDISNLQMVCSIKCNSRKYYWAEAESKRERIGLDGFPAGSEWSS